MSTTLPNWDFGRRCVACDFAAPDCCDRITLHGTRFVRLLGPEGDELYVTRRGWSMLPYLLPPRWFTGGKYFRQGERLQDSTGSVFKYTVDGPHGPRDLVVKVNRVGQEVMLAYDPEDGLLQPDDVYSAAFLDPFHEIALTDELANTPHPETGGYLHIKWPLAVYHPNEHLADYQTGRKTWLFERANKELQNDFGDAPETERVALERDSRYIVLYRWIRGTNAADMVRRELLTHEECMRLVRRIANELAVRGFQVLDLKPTHIIVRENDGEIVRDHDGWPLFGLVDFELLRRLE